MAESKGRTKARDWKKSSATLEQDLELPSGNIALVRRVTPEAFLASGTIPDPLTNIIRESIHDKKGLPPSKIEEIATDPALIGSALQMMDSVLCFCVREPSVQMPPKCRVCGFYYTEGNEVHTNKQKDDYHDYQEDMRDPEILYADDVDLEDKFFIFQFAVGGTRDLERFRTQLSGGLGNVLDGEDVPDQAEQPVGDRE